MALDGKRIVIIGGTSGIGRAVAAAALAEGAEIFIGSSRLAKIEEAQRLLGAKAQAATIDCTNEESIAAFFKQTGEIDHLVYTAGDWGNRDPRDIGQVEADELTKTMSVRVVGALLAVKHATPRIRPGGSITLTGGIVAHRPRKGAPLASVMGGAVEHLVYGLAVDLAPIRVNAVIPGAIATDVWGADAAEKFRGLTDRLPVSRMGRPEEVAEAYLYLMKGGYTTGQNLRVDGGLTLV